MGKESIPTVLLMFWASPWVFPSFQQSFTIIQRQTTKQRLCESFCFLSIWLWISWFNTSKIFQLFQSVYLQLPECIKLYQIISQDGERNSDIPRTRRHDMTPKILMDSGAGAGWWSFRLGQGFKAENHGGRSVGKLYWAAAFISVKLKGRIFYR